MTSETFYAGKRSDEWQTPQELFERLNKQYKFDLDLAASESNTKCKNFFSKDNSYLNSVLVGQPNAWMNPPFSLAYEFFKKVGIDFTSQDNVDATAVCIYKASNMESSVWQEQILPKASWVLVLKRRTNYVDPEQSERDSAPFGSALIGYRAPYPESDKELGTLINLVEGLV